MGLNILDFTKDTFIVVMPRYPTATTFYNFTTKSLQLTQLLQETNMVCSTCVAIILYQSTLTSVFQITYVIKDNFLMDPGYKTKPEPKILNSATLFLFCCRHIFCLTGHLISLVRSSLHGHALDIVNAPRAQKATNK